MARIAYVLTMPQSLQLCVDTTTDRLILDLNNAVWYKRINYDMAFISVSD